MGRNLYLRITFERLLLDKIKDVLAELSDNERKYREYLEASGSDILACHGGYFSQDNSDSDETVAFEVTAIAKLRSSGSENSKLQEVGRGLRLPVDENGNRVSNEEFKLNYIVDFTEADFAQKLVDEINGDLPETHILSDALLDKVAKEKYVARRPCHRFDAKKYIDSYFKILPENRDAFYVDTFCFMMPI